MTSAQRTNLIAQRRQLREDIRKLERAMIDLASQEFVSVSLSSGGGSKSFSRSDTGRIQQTIAHLADKIAAINAALSGTASPGGIRTIKIVRC